MVKPSNILKFPIRRLTVKEMRQTPEPEKFAAYVIQGRLVATQFMAAIQEEGLLPTADDIQSLRNLSQLLEADGGPPLDLAFLDEIILPPESD